MKRKADSEVTPMVLARRMLRRHSEVCRRLRNFEKRYRYLFQSVGLDTGDGAIPHDVHTVSTLRQLHLPAIDQEALERYLMDLQEERAVADAVEKIQNTRYREIAEYRNTGASADDAMKKFGVSMSTVRRAMREAAGRLAAALSESDTLCSTQSDTFTPQKRTK